MFFKVCSAGGAEKVCCHHTYKRYGGGGDVHKGENCLFSFGNEKKLFAEKENKRSQIGENIRCTVNGN